jgi:hypothetical protein
LYDLRALTGQFGSAGFGLRVLLEGAIGDSVECEVYPGQVAFGNTADGAGFAAQGDAPSTRDCCQPAMKASFNTEVSCAVGTEQIIVRGILPLLRTDMLRKVAERLNKPLRGGVLVLEWRRYPS